MRWLGRISAADVATLFNGLCGFLAITYILDGRFVVASLLIIVALVFDGLDGIIARRFGSNHHFGRFLDSMSDSVSFCFAPALLVYANFYNKDLGSAWVNMENAVAVMTAFFIGGLGLLRLARFSAKQYKHRDFLGFPTPSMALVVIVFTSLFGPVDLNPLSYGEKQYEISLLFIILALLMVSDIPFPKIRGIMLHLSILAGFIVAVPFLFYYLGPGAFTLGQLRAVQTLAAIPIMAYLIVGPFYVKRRRGGRKAQIYKPEK